MSEGLPWLEAAGSVLPSSAPKAVLTSFLGAYGSGHRDSCGSWFVLTLAGLSTVVQIGPPAVAVGRAMAEVPIGCCRSHHLETHTACSEMVHASGTPGSVYGWWQVGHHHQQEVPAPWRTCLGVHVACQQKACQDRLRDKRSGTVLEDWRHSFCGALGPHLRSLRAFRPG